MAWKGLSAVANPHRLARAQVARVEIRYRRLDAEIVQLRNLRHQLPAGDARTFVGHHPGQHAGERRAHLRLRLQLLLLRELLLQDGLLQLRGLDVGLCRPPGIGDRFAMLAQFDLGALDRQRCGVEVGGGGSAELLHALVATEFHLCALEVEPEQFDVAGQLFLLLLHLQRERLHPHLLLGNLLFEIFDREPDRVVVQLQQQLAGGDFLPGLDVHVRHAGLDRARHLLFVHRDDHPGGVDGVGDVAPPYLDDADVAQRDARADGAVDAPGGEGHRQQDADHDHACRALPSADRLRADWNVHMQCFSGLPGEH